MRDLTTQKLLGTYNKVKMINGVQDQGGSSYSQASFSQTQLRMGTAGAVYNTWTDNLSSTSRVVISTKKAPADPTSADKFTIITSPHSLPNLTQPNRSRHI
ncbi:hypothetical protein JI735_34300 (plasmid) [Paenibacillus sonchi]|uniref:Uncharacterized protein n=1 Tax=Paenibacillus sonchi TaxID=373687 RepID=A0A974SFZ3_9BACL|nr:hypothetical protein [Paenibacillus sonchi]QQZ64512.1 hypothetical protein JI735_34300 [Paenibacillus sonchi]